ncbi:MAG: hypothetical protein ACTSXQ_08035 [Alphaproteobacteria bacterium]
MFNFLLNGLFKKETISTQEELRRGRDAQHLIENALFQESFGILRASLMEEWQGTAILEGKQRERLWLMLKLLDALKHNLETLIESGKLAERSLITLKN